MFKGVKNLLGLRREALADTLTLRQRRWAEDSSSRKNPKIYLLKCLRLWQCRGAFMA